MSFSGIFIYRNFFKKVEFCTKSSRKHFENINFIQKRSWTSEIHTFYLKFNALEIIFNEVFDELVTFVF